MNRDSTTAKSEGPAALVARMAEGDDRALAELYDAYGHVAYALAFAIIGAQSVAEVVVSQAFGEAWRSASAFNAREMSVLAWLTSIVRRIALTVGHAKPTSSGRDKKGAPTGGNRAWSTSVSPVGEALRSLSAAQRRVVELSYYGGLTVGEIAAQLGEPESGARELLRSAMKELRSALGTGRSGVFDKHVVTRA